MNENYHGIVFLSPLDNGVPHSLYMISNAIIVQHTSLHRVATAQVYAGAYSLFIEELEKHGCEVLAIIRYGATVIEKTVTETIYKPEVRYSRA